MTAATDAAARAVAHRETGPGVGASDTAAVAPGAERSIVAFCCRECAYAAADTSANARTPLPPTVRLILLPCTGRVSPLHLLSALAEGADGVMVAGCLEGQCHYSALASSQAIGLHHDRRAYFLDIGQRLIGIGKHFKISGWDTGFGHHSLGKDLAAFELGAVSRRTKTADAKWGKAVGQSCNKWRFGAWHNEVDRLLLDEGYQAVDIQHLQSDKLCQLRYSRIPRRAVQPGHLRALGQFPDQGVLAPTRSDYKHFQQLSLPWG